jgi:MinD-like ATPase involved in chromosome partitioning or flagellar assembly
MEGLRHFVAATGREHWRTDDDRVVVIGSGKGGCGTSTVAALLGIACAAEGHRTLLVDGDELVGTLHRLFGVDAPLGLGGLRSGSVAPAGCVLELDGGLSVLPGGPGADASGRHHAHVLSAGERRSLFRRVAQLYRNYDVVIVDAGSRLDTVITAGAAGARRFVAVSGAGTVAIAANYALVKAIELKWPGAPLDVIANRLDDQRGRIVFDQLQEASSRFLGRALDYAGAIPEDGALLAAALSGQPLRLIADHTVAGQAARVLAQRLLVQLNDGARRSAAPDGPLRRR